MFRFFSNPLPPPKVRTIAGLLRNSTETLFRNERKCIESQPRARIAKNLELMKAVGLCTRSDFPCKFRWTGVLVILLCCICCRVGAQGRRTLPMVAVHDSELTRALETMPAVPPTPMTTSNQWWATAWHYFVMPDSVKEALRSDGTAFTVVGDSNISAGALLTTSGQPAYPIVISLASEA